jgi:hypothetical protein
LFLPGAPKKRIKNRGGGGGEGEGCFWSNTNSIVDRRSRGGPIVEGGKIDLT